MNRVCTKWGNTNIAWSVSDWTFDECEIVSDCVRWGTTNTWWKAANWKWPECTSSFVPPQPVSGGSLQPPGVDATTLIQPWLVEPWNPYLPADEKDKKRKRLIRLICKVKGEEYNEEKQAKSYNITVDDIKLVVKKVAGIDLDLRMEE